jgi:hypothetical protein
MSSGGEWEVVDALPASLETLELSEAFLLCSKVINVDRFSLPTLGILELLCSAKETHWRRVASGALLAHHCCVSKKTRNEVADLLAVISDGGHVSSEDDTLFTRDTREMEESKMSEDANNNDSKLLSMLTSFTLHLTRLLLTSPALAPASKSNGIVSDSECKEGAIEFANRVCTASIDRLISARSRANNSRTNGSNDNGDGNGGVVIRQGNNKIGGPSGDGDCYGGNCLRFVTSVLEALPSLSPSLCMPQKARLGLLTRALNLVALEENNVKVASSSSVHAVVPVAVDGHKASTGTTRMDADAVVRALIAPILGLYQHSCRRLGHESSVAQGGAQGSLDEQELMECTTKCWKAAQGLLAGLQVRRARNKRCPNYIYRYTHTHSTCTRHHDSPICNAQPDLFFGISV